VWRLSPAQLDREIERLLGPGAPDVILPEGAPDHGISNIAAGAQIDDGNASVLAEGIRGVGVWAADNGASTSRCGATFGTDACIDSFLDWFPSAAYRRPVTAEERTELRTLHDELRTAIDADFAYAGLVRAVLLSPDFLYRTELGPAGSSGARTTLTQHEIATLLAFTATDRAPDDELLDAADRGALGDPDGRSSAASCRSRVGCGSASSGSGSTWTRSARRRWRSASPMRCAARWKRSTRPSSTT
jgi:hypothetical protein